MDKDLIYNYIDYREYLMAEFSVRKAERGKLSLRKFARELGISTTSLSDVLKGKVGLSLKKAVQIAQSLGLDSNGKKRFVDLVQLGDAPTQALRELARERVVNIQSFTALDPKNLILLNDWHHYALLELMNTEVFKPDLNWISRKLGLSKIVVQRSVRRLRQLGLICKTTFKPAHANIYVRRSIEVRNESLKLKAQLLQKSELALKETPDQLKCFASLVFTMDPAQVPNLKKMIDEFLFRIVKSNELGRPKRVFVINFQSHPLDKDGD